MARYSTESLTAALNGSPRYVGTIVAASATLVNNQSTAAPFSISPGHVYLLQGDQAHWFLPAHSQVVDGSGAGASTPANSNKPGNPALTTTGTNGVLKALAAQYVVVTGPIEDLLQVVGNGATATVKVFEMLSDTGNF